MTKNENMVSRLEQIRIQHAAPAGSDSYALHVFYALPANISLDDDVDLIPVVLYEVNGKKKTQKGKMDRYKHTRDDIDSGAFATKTNGVYESPPLFHVILKDLPFCSTLEYMVGLAFDKENLYKPDRRISYRTPPKTGESCLVMSHDEENHFPELKVTVCGDIGQTDYSKRTLDLILDRHFEKDGDLFQGVLIVGDMAYADGDQTRWDSWGRMFEPLFSKTPVIALTGNHEIELDKETHETFLPYRKRFFGTNKKEETAPATDVTAKQMDDYTFAFHYNYGASYYSLDLGKIHMIVLNTYNTAKEGERHQKKWLIDDLEAVDRSKTPFIVLADHAPLTSTSQDHQNEQATLKLASWLRPIINKYKIEAMFSGHVHAYERLHKMNNTVFITIGDGGNHEKLYDAWYDDNLSRELSAVRSGQYYGSGELEIYNSSHMKWKWLPDPEQWRDLKSAWNGDDDIRYDEIWIVSNVHQTDFKSMEQKLSSAKTIPFWGLAVVLILIGFFSIRTKSAKSSTGSKYEPLNTATKDVETSNNDFGTF